MPKADTDKAKPPSRPPICKGMKPIRLARLRRDEESYGIGHLLQVRIGREHALFNFKLLSQQAVYLCDDFFSCYNSVYKFLMIRVELVPPKPNELLRNRSKCCWRVSGRTLMRCVTSSGF